MSLQTQVESLVTQLKSDGGIAGIDNISHDDYFPMVTNNVCLLFPPHNNKSEFSFGEGQGFKCATVSHTIDAEIWVKYIRGQEAANMLTIRSLGNLIVQKIVQKEGSATYYIDSDANFEFVVNTSLVVETELPWFHATLTIPILEFTDYS